MTPPAERARRVPLFLAPDRVRALFAAEIEAAVAEAVRSALAAIAGRPVARCWYCDEPIFGKRRDARYCSHRCRQASYAAVRIRPSRGGGFRPVILADA